MIYEDFLKGCKVCPFCDLKSNEIIKKNKFAILTLAQAPYCKDHLLVTCKHHNLKLTSMSASEKKAVDDLINYGIKLLHSKYKNVTILYREGNLKEVGKSVEHLHYHLIPEVQVGVVGSCKRDIVSDKKFSGMINSFKERFIRRNV